MILHPHPLRVLASRGTRASSSGPSRRYGPAMSGRYAQSCNSKGERAISPCSISRSTASFAAVTSWRYFAKLYDRKTPINAADLLNDRVIPFFDGHDVKLMRVLTDRGSEYCGNPERHEYELYLAVEDVDHSRTKTKSPQTNGKRHRGLDHHQHWRLPRSGPLGVPGTMTVAGNLGFSPARSTSCKSIPRRPRPPM